MSLQTLDGPATPISLLFIQAIFDLICNISKLWPQTIANTSALRDISRMAAALDFSYSINDGTNTQRTGSRRRVDRQEEMRESYEYIRAR